MSQPCVGWCFNWHTFGITRHPSLIFPPVQTRHQKQKVFTPFYGPSTRRWPMMSLHTLYCSDKVSKWAEISDSANINANKWRGECLIQCSSISLGNKRGKASLCQTRVKVLSGQKTVWQTFPISRNLEVNSPSVSFYFKDDRKSSHSSFICFFPRSDCETPAYIFVCSSIMIFFLPLSLRDQNCGNELTLDDGLILKPPVM